MRDKIIGGDSLGLVAESFKLQYRTAGISDNSGGWNSISEGNSLAGVAGASQIQFRFLFRMISPFCIGSRIFCVGVTYNVISTASNFQPSIGKSDVTTKRFTYWFSTAFGSTVPTLYMRIYDALIGSLLVTDNSALPSGTWEKSTDGSTWSAYDTNDKANTTTYIRYTPASLADNINVRSVLTLA